MMSVICLAMSGWILVLRLVLAMLVRMDCFNNDVGHLLGHVGVDLGVEAGAGNACQDGLLLLASDRNLHRVKNLESLHLGLIEALSDDPGMETLRNVKVGLFQELSDQEDG